MNANQRDCARRRRNDRMPEEICCAHRDSPTWGTKGLLNIMPSPAVSYTHGSLLTLIFVGDLNHDSRDGCVRSATTECSAPSFVHLIRARQNQTLEIGRASCRER